MLHRTSRDVRLIIDKEGIPTDSGDRGDILTVNLDAKDPCCRWVCARVGGDVMWWMQRLLHEALAAS